jgi:hypothetical protein
MISWGWFWLGLSRSCWFGSSYAAGAKPMCVVHGLATGGMPVSSIGLATGGIPVSSVGLAIGGMHVTSVGLAIGGMPVSSVGFGYRWDVCERWSVWLQV